MSNSRERVSHLTPQQRALLEQRLLGRRQLRTDPIEPDDFAPQPLSFAQESLWFFNQLTPESPLYNMPQAFRLSGHLNYDAVQTAFNNVVARQHALRTQFVTVDGVPRQITPDKPFELRFIDLAALPLPEREVELQRLLDAEGRKPFDLGGDLMIRATIIRLGAEAHVLTITLHHIVADFASLGVLFQELGAAYGAALRDTPLTLPPLPVSFPSWAARQRRFGESGALQRSLGYWKQRLSGNVPALQMPSDRPRGPARRFQGAGCPVGIAAPLTRALKSVAQQEGVTLYMFLLAAFKTLLHRYSGQEDIVVGSPLDCRTDAGTRLLVGLFLNVLVLRSNLAGDPTFRDVLQRVREAVIGALGHQAVPFEALVQELHLPRSAGTNPLCQVVFQYLPCVWPSLHLEGVTVERIPMETGTAKFDLTLTILESDSGLAGELEYDTDLFDEATAARLVANFSVLLESIVANPSERITRLKVLTDSERQQVLVEWNQTATPYPRASCVHELFQEQVRSRPDVVALVWGEQAISYDELNRRANRLARWLVHQGVQPGALVGLCVERSPEMIVCLLAILKCGGAYLPLDPQYPTSRLRLLLAEAGAAVLLTFSRLPDAASLAPKRILLDAEHGGISAQDDTDLPKTVSAEDRVYAMFTSGSTGQPKAVAVPHRAVVRLVKRANFADFTPSEVFLQFAPLSFDASTFEIWGPLLNGARLILYPTQFESLEHLVEVLNRHRVTTLWLTSGLFQQVIEQHLPRLQSVRQLLAGGDVLSVPHVLQALKGLPACQLINGYGPTENTTFTCCYRFPRHWDGTASAPIGRPISDTQVYILDQLLEPVPIGVRGELYAAGDGLAHGYLNSPELTAEKFVSNPFSADPSARTYRTGDQARYLSDGNIEFLGRFDDQVKINGFRLHLGEVELALQRIPGIRQAAVAVRGDAAASKELVAYVVLEAGVTVSGLRQAAAQALPSYMVPALFVLLSSLPLTPNGKIDRRALPSVTDAAAVEHKTVVPPESPLQGQILEIWKEVFGREDIGIDDNFFDLGGHSLLATRVISRLKRALQSSVPLGILFNAPTVRELAAAISSIRREDTPGPIPRRTRPDAR